MGRHCSTCTCEPPERDALKVRFYLHHAQSVNRLQTTNARGWWVLREGLDLDVGLHTVQLDEKGQPWAIDGIKVETRWEPTP